MADADDAQLPTWPYRYDSRRQVPWTAAISGAGAAIFVVLLNTVLAGRGRPSVGVSIGLLLIVPTLITGVVANVSGRIRLTPTALLRVPVIGRPRWVAFADVRRVRTSPKNFAMDVGGRIWTLQWQQMARGKAIKATRDMVRGWLSADFEIALPQPGLKSKSYVVVQVVTVATVVGWMVLFNLSQRPLSRFIRTIVPATQPAGRLAVVVMLATLVPLGMWIGVVFVVQRLTQRWVAADVHSPYRWAHRRAAGHGFEVTLLDRPPAG